MAYCHRHGSKSKSKPRELNCYSIGPPPAKRAAWCWHVLYRSICEGFRLQCDNDIKGMSSNFPNWCCQQQWILSHLEWRKVYVYCWTLGHCHVTANRAWQMFGWVYRHELDSCCPIGLEQCQQSLWRYQHPKWHTWCCLSPDRSPEGTRNNKRYLDGGFQTR